MLGCVPLSDTQNPDKPKPDISIGNALYAPHFIHLEATVNNITTDLEVGFLISTAAAVPQNPTSKQGYISRTFSSSTPKRQLLLFMHDATAYTDTDAVNTFESADFLQADTKYYLHIFNDSLSTEPQAFTTMSYETLNAAGNSIAVLDGLGNTDAASITRIIERKADEPTILPSVIFGGGYASTTALHKNFDAMLCSYNTKVCVANSSGLRGYHHYQGVVVDYHTVLVTPNIRADSAIWTVLTGLVLIYTLQINTITE
ncbi:hypothetical protein P0082_06310 [Candidatus Haliotispira prima]|uniref:Uncharacterized protein n=1 Tax=Candidatus Haliotispira prima TaxID=3034016 RepID=A0ABY8MFY3_9SPIO|nr:hypothetical protein P0082_06310 [Candidatus Haliotispira prima]